MSSGTNVRESFAASIQAAAAIASDFADAVDRDARFPLEAIDCLRKSGALGVSVPRELGGCNVSFLELCNACFELARRCGSSGMIFAMHQIQMASIMRHLGQSDFLRTYLTNIVRSGRLIASVTAEEGTDGDLRQSRAALELSAGGGARLEKVATMISYCPQADDFLVSLRRSPSAERNDQVLVLINSSQATLKQTDSSDVLGMRGTCTAPYIITAEFSSEQVIPIPFATIASETMVPYAHILWAHCWLGIATDAAYRARTYARTRWQRSSMGGVDLRLSRLFAELSAMRATVQAAQAEYDSIKDEFKREQLSALGYAIRINNVKLLVSEAAVRICLGALDICGIAGYRNGTKFSVGRNLRDALSAPLMVANDRIYAANANSLLISDGA